jgi:hypothetical protein
MSNFKVTLKNKTTKNRFHIDLIYEPKEEKEISFGFGNSSKSLERTDLEFLDEDFALVEPIGMMIKNPLKREKVKMFISKEKPFVYEIIGKIDHHNDAIHIKLVSVEYLLKKGKKYYIHLRYKGEVSEKIQLEF